MKHFYLLILPICLLPVCVSCSPSGSRPTSAESQTPEALTLASGEPSVQDEEAAIKLTVTDWAAFLGTDGKARSTDVVPTTWSDSENVLWKRDLLGSGSSSPIIVGDRVILTCYVAGAVPVSYTHLTLPTICSV